MTQRIHASVEFMLNASSTAAFSHACDEALESMNLKEEHLAYYTGKELREGTSHSKFVKCGFPHLAMRWESLPPEAVEPFMEFALGLRRMKLSVHLVIEDGRERSEIRYQRIKEVV